MADPTGYRFHPTVEELVNYYLRRKMSGHDDEVNMIPEINLLEVEPWEIPGKAMRMSNNPNDQVWYFFSSPNYMYSNSQRVDRKTKAGFWKVTGKDIKILDVGVKKTLVFYKGQSANAERTDWVMHQYNATFKSPTKKDFVICKLKNKADADDIPAVELAQGQSGNYIEHPNNHGGEFNQQLPFNSGYYPTEDDSYQLQAHMQFFRGYNEMDYSLDSAIKWSNGNNYYG